MKNNTNNCNNINNNSNKINCNIPTQNQNNNITLNNRAPKQTIVVDNNTINVNTQQIGQLLPNNYTTKTWILNTILIK